MVYILKYPTVSMLLGNLQHHIYPVIITTQIILPGKKADMALTVDETKSVFFIDCPCSKQGDFIQYDFLEELKNGRLFSSKYNSMLKRLPVKPHILVVLMNESPNETKLSRDRYLIYDLHQDGSFTIRQR